MGTAYHWNFAPVFENADVLWAGAIGTLRLFVICVVLGFGFGLVVGLGRHARSRWVYLPATAFVEFFRNTPVLVQILWFYYALPILLPFEISPLAAAVLGISLTRRRSRPRSTAAASPRSIAARPRQPAPSA